MQESTTCARKGCDAERAPKPPTGPQSLYCSRQCRDNESYRRSASRIAERRKVLRAARIVESRPDRNCEVCGHSFSPKQKRSRACSKGCARKLAVLGKTCDQPECTKPQKAAGMCAAHYLASHPNGRKWKKNGRPEVRRAALRKKTQQRRARTKGDADAELIDRNEIGQRDSWRCGLCGKRVSQTLAYPHPRSASLDHIEPLSRGGKHVKANVQISHLGCNIAKSNRGGGEQLLLIG